MALLNTFPVWNADYCSVIISILILSRFRMRYIVNEVLDPITSIYNLLVENSTSHIQNVWILMPTKRTKLRLLQLMLTHSYI